MKKERQKKMFKMGELITLYNEDKDKYYEYLYNNTPLFMSQTRIRNLENRFGAEDLYHDCFMKLVHWSSKSIEGGYHEKQIYRYLITRLRGYLINKTKEPITIHESYLGGDAYEVWKDNLEQELSDRYGVEGPDRLQNEYLKDMFYSFVWGLTGDERRVMSMHYMGEQNSLRDIAKYLGIPEKSVYLIHNKLLKRASKFILNNNLGNYQS